MPITPRVAAIHDMSGFGRSSLMAAIPVLSAMGIQCCPLPTAYLSTHTGEFTGYSFLDMTEEMPKAARHWREIGVTFDAIYSGFLASERQIDILMDFIAMFKRENTRFVMDPVMGDHGKMYDIYTERLCRGIARIAEHADIITPNLTEAAFLLGTPYAELMTDRAGYTACVERLSLNGRRSVVLTGVSLEPGLTGAACFDAEDGAVEFMQTDFIGKEFHSTGDLFASVLTGAVVRGDGLKPAVQLAVEFVRACVERSCPQNIPPREGVDFEPLLWKLHQWNTKV